MMNLDDRARSAVTGLRAAVDSVELRLGERPPGVVDRTGVGRSWWAFAAGAALAGIVLLGTMIETFPDVAAPDDTTRTTSAVTTTTDRVVSTAPPPVIASTSIASTTTSTVVDTVAPEIVITSPEDGFVSEVASITFTGTTEPGSSVTAGPYEASVEADGTWHIVLLLSEGENRARFVATDAAGNSSEAWVTVVLKSPDITTTTNAAEQTTTTEAPAVEFTAHSTLGVSNETPPFDVYYGTDQPGAVVEISSPYGSGRVEVGQSGTWEVRVEFPESPVGKTIEVVVEDTLGHRRVLTFQRV